MEPLERALGELQEQNYGSAIRTLEMLTARDPSNAEAYKHLAQAYFRTGQREQAAEAAQRYASLRPTDPQGHYNAGVILAQLGQAAGAERAFRAAISADPGYAKAHEALAKLAPPAEATVRAPSQAAGAASAATPATTSAAAAATAAPATAPTATKGQRGPMPLQAKIAAGGTVVASIAILLWLFLPGGPANPGPPKVSPTPSPSGITTPPPTAPSGDQPNPAPPEQSPGTTEAPKAPEPKASAPEPEASKGPTAPAPRALTQDQVARALEPLKNDAMGQFAGQLDGIIKVFNDPRFNGENVTFWDIIKTAVATEGLKSLQTGPTPGELEIMQIIQNSACGADAGQALSARKAKIAWDSWLAFLQEVWNTIQSKDNMDEAYAAIKAAEVKHGIQPLPVSEQQLQANLRQLYAR